MSEPRAERLREIARGAAPHVSQPAEVVVPLFQHQLAVVEYATLAPRMILGDAPATGKDFSAIAAMVAAGRRPFIVCSPPVLLGVWHRHLEQSLPSHRFVSFATGAEVTPANAAGADILLLRHRQMRYTVDAFPVDWFGGIIFDQCQMAACRWSELAMAMRAAVGRLRDDAPVIASSSRVARSPRSLASVVEIIGRLDRHPQLAAARDEKSWASVPNAPAILADLAADCWLARGLKVAAESVESSGANRLAAAG
jgi:hypothetical protein